VYSDLFDRLPTTVSERVYRRLYEALTVEETGGRYGLLAADRDALLAIVIDTKPNLPNYWRSRSQDGVVGDQQ
jgi:hypothetical protein